MHLILSGTNTDLKSGTRTGIYYVKILRRKLFFDFENFVQIRVSCTTAVRGRSDIERSNARLELILIFKLTGMIRGDPGRPRPMFVTDV